MGLSGRNHREKHPKSMLPTSRDSLTIKLDMWHDSGVALQSGTLLHFTPDELDRSKANPLLQWALDLGYRCPVQLQLDQCTNQHEEK